MRHSKDIKQNRSGTENIDICFCIIFDRHYQSFVSGKETGHYTLSLPNFEIFQNLILSREASREAAVIQCFLVPDNKYQFTCAVLNIY